MARVALPIWVVSPAFMSFRYATGWRRHARQRRAEVPEKPRQQPPATASIVCSARWGDDTGTDPKIWPSPPRTPGADGRDGFLGIGCLHGEKRGGCQVIGAAEEQSRLVRSGRKPRGKHHRPVYVSERVRAVVLLVYLNAA